MSARLRLARFLIRTSEAIRSLGMLVIRQTRIPQLLAVLVMRPEELIQFTQESYSRERSVDYFCRQDIVDAGLDPDETAISDLLPASGGKLLVLGLGGGREAIHFSRAGFKVVGVDFVPEMVQRAKQIAASRGVELDGLVQDMSTLDLADNGYDIAWVSQGMYSAIPTRSRRIEMLRRVGGLLNTGGYLTCTFTLDESRGGASPGGMAAKKALAFLALGNKWYENGDTISNNSEFVHVFCSVEELLGEFESGGFELVQMRTRENPRAWSLALLRKSS